MVIRMVPSKVDCAECPLNYRTMVCGEGKRQGKIIFLGEAPGRDEDRIGAPFVGRSGEYLNTVLEDAGISRRENWVTNVIYCRPPDNDFDHPHSQVARKLCKRRLEDELAELYSLGYRFVMALGGNACTPFFYKKPTISVVRGQFVNLSSGLILVPTYHPSYICRSIPLSKRETSSLWALWESDFLKVKEKSQEA